MPASSNCLRVTTPYDRAAIRPISFSTVVVWGRITPISDHGKEIRPRLGRITPISDHGKEIRPQLGRDFVAQELACRVSGERRYLLDSLGHLEWGQVITRVC